MKLGYYIIGLFTLTLLACNTGPAPIDYGEDSCDFCRMHIVDRQHAAEIVTNKGKVYKYDAIECMLNDHEHNQASLVDLFLVTDYNLPGTLIDAQQATFLISESIPSPMGEYLSSFRSAEEAIAVKETNDGEIYNWEGILSRFDN